MPWAIPDSRFIREEGPSDSEADVPLFEVQAEQPC